MYVENPLQSSLSTNHPPWYVGGADLQQQLQVQHYVDVPIWFPPSPRDLSLVFDLSALAKFVAPSSWMSFPPKPIDCRLETSPATLIVHVDHQS